MNNTIGTYYIGLKQEELILDVDDLIGIMHQLEALSLGYDAMAFSWDNEVNDVYKVWKMENETT